ncbi:hypothetical protein D5F85_04040 [Streptococcus agalactiae]|nr:hypothetical protein D5F85_04040 [Streptococcus agalactiae]
MRIEALMEKERRVQYRLLSFLRGSPQAIALKLALLETGLSRATLLKYINNLNSYFEQEKVNCRIVYYKDKLFLEEDYNLSNQEVLKALMKDSIKYTIPVVLVNLKNTIKSLKGLYCECLNKQEVSPNEPLTVYS